MKPLAMVHPDLNLRGKSEKVSFQYLQASSAYKGWKAPFIVSKIQKLFVMSNNDDHSLNVLRDEKRRLLERIATIDDMIELIEKSMPYANGETSAPKSKSKQKPTGYSSRKPMVFKVLYVIKQLNRFLHSTEIRKEIAELDGTTFEKVNISATLSQLKRNKKICKKQIGKQNRNSFWGSPKWLDSNGVILKEHLFDKSLLSEDSSMNQIKF